MINCIVTLLINKLIEHMVMFTVLESQANLTKPPVFVLVLGTDAVWCQRYHCLLGIRKSMPNNGYKVTEVIRDHENLKENEVDTVPLNMPWTAPILHQKKSKMLK